MNARAETNRHALVLAALLAATPAHADTLAVTGATIYTRPDQKLDNATIIVRDGKIVDVGRGVAVPAGATTLDGTGKVVTAGLIEASTLLGLVEISLEHQMNDGQFGTAPVEVHAGYRSADAFDARSVAIPIARSGGVTSAITGPTGGLVAGQAMWISLADAGPAPIRATVAVNAALGRGAVAKTSRGHAALHLRRLLDDVALYRRDKAAFDRNQARKLAADRQDLEAMLPVLAGQQLLVIRASSEVDMRAALAIAAEYKLRIAIAGGTEAWRLAKELAAAKVAVILDPTDNLPSDLVATDARDDNAALLAKAGVPVVISTLGNQLMTRTLRQLAGIAVGNGLPWADALAALTTAPARLYGAKDRGTLDKGSVADLVVWTGDPFELATRAETVIINGTIQPTVTHQSRLRDRYRTLPK